MATDKRINYEMQGHKKPARNYLGKQKTVKNVPVKWKSGPKAPETELAYITKAEKNLLVKKDLHGSLKKGPNTGPDGIMSLDSQGDYTRDRSPAGRQSSPGGPDRSRQAQAQHEQALREVLTGQVDRGQTAAVSDRVRQGAVPEWVNTPSGRKYVGSAYKDTGKRGFLSRLFGGANRYGYAPVRGVKSIEMRKYPTGQDEYFSEDEEVGDIKPGYGGRILGGLAGLATGLPFVGPMIGGAINRFKRQPQDMSQFNTLGAAQTGTASNVPMATRNRWTDPINQKVNIDNQFDHRKALWNTDMVSGTDDTTHMRTSSPTNIFPTAGLGSAEGGRIGYQEGGGGGRIGYQGGEFVDKLSWASPGGAGFNLGKMAANKFKETDFIEGPGFDVNENIEMAEGPDIDELIEARVQELMDEGLDWGAAMAQAKREFGMAEGEEESFSEEGIASVV